MNKLGLKFLKNCQLTRFHILSRKVHKVTSEGRKALEESHPKQLTIAIPQHCFEDATSNKHIMGYGYLEIAGSKKILPGMPNCCQDFYLFITYFRYQMSPSCLLVVDSQLTDATQVYNQAKCSSLDLTTVFPSHFVSKFIDTEWGKYIFPGERVLPIVGYTRRLPPKGYLFCASSIPKSRQICCFSILIKESPK